MTIVFVVFLTDLNKTRFLSELLKTNGDEVDPRPPILGIHELGLLGFVEAIDKRHSHGHPDPAPRSRLPVQTFEASALGNLTQDALQDLLNGGQRLLRRLEGWRTEGESCV